MFCLINISRKKNNIAKHIFNITNTKYEKYNLNALT